MPDLGTHNHVGIVVPDVAAARVQLTEELGVRWGPIMHLDQAEYRQGDSPGGPAGDVLLPTTICYSVDEPRIELIEAVPGSEWEVNGHSNLHHIGYWSDDLPADSAALTSGGCPLSMCGRAGTDAPVSFAYHRSSLGIRIEVIDAGMRDAMQFLFKPDAG